MDLIILKKKKYKGEYRPIFQELDSQLKVYMPANFIK
jgi:hypothetical protein